MVAQKHFCRECDICILLGVFEQFMCSMVKALQCKLAAEGVIARGAAGPGADMHLPLLSMGITRDEVLLA